MMYRSFRDRAALAPGRVQRARWLAIVGCTLAFVLCGCDDDDESDLVPDAPAQSTTLRAMLTGSQEAPPTAVSVTGEATLTVARAEDRVDVELAADGLENVTAAHVHAGVPGENGPIIVTLYDSTRDGVFDGSLSITVTETDLNTEQSAITSFAAAVDAMLAGETYVNVHTVALPDGAIRGHLGQARVELELLGANEVPAVDIGATGTAVVVLDEAQSELEVELSAAELDNATAAHIHVGPPGVNGPIVFTLFESSDGALPITLDLTVSMQELEPRPEQGIETFEDALEALLTGNLYVNVHTTEYPDGAIRGQILPGMLTDEPAAPVAPAPDPEPMPEPTPMY